MKRVFRYKHMLNTLLILPIYLLCILYSHCEKDLEHSIYQTFETEGEAISFQEFEGADRLISNQDLVVTLSRSWWNATRFLIIKSHEQDCDISSTVRSMVGDIMKNGEEVLRLLDKKHDDVAIMSPAFQWAQSLNDIYLNVKFAYRWNSPGALSIENELFHTNGTHFEFSGIGSHSGFRKKYVLSLELYDTTLQPLEWKFASVGKVQITLKKEKPMLWERLIKDTKKISNMSTWWDLQEKLDENSSRIESQKDTHQNSKNATSPTNSTEKLETTDDDDEEL